MLSIGGGGEAMWAAPSIQAVISGLLSRQEEREAAGRPQPASGKPVRA
jgi:hypothetical protein